MLPLGLINFVAVALLDEFQQLLGYSTVSTVISVVLAWGVCIGAWLGMSYASPLIADNRAIPASNLPTSQIPA